MTAPKTPEEIAENILRPNDMTCFALGEIRDRIIEDVADAIRQAKDAGLDHSKEAYRSGWDDAMEYIAKNFEKSEDFRHLAGRVRHFLGSKIRSFKTDHRPVEMPEIKKGMEL